MSDVVPIITIETENGPVDINMSDFDPSVHKVAGGESQESQSTAKGGKGKK